MVAAPPKKGVHADAVDKMRKHFKIEAPGADRLHQNAHDILMEPAV